MLKLFRCFSEVPLLIGPITELSLLNHATEQPRHLIKQRLSNAVRVRIWREVRQCFCLKEKDTERRRDEQISKMFIESLMKFRVETLEKNLSLGRFCAKEVSLYHRLVDQDDNLCDQFTPS